MLAEQMDRSVLKIAGFDQVRDKISLFGGLSDEQLDRLLANTKECTVKAGETVFDQGQLPCNVYIVLTGEIRMEIHRTDNSKRDVVYCAGDCFGETAVIGIQPQLGHTLASCDSRLLVLSRACLLDLVNIDKELFGILMMNVAREVSRRLHSFCTTPDNAKEYVVERA